MTVGQSAWTCQVFPPVKSVNHFRRSLKWRSSIGRILLIGRSRHKDRLKVRRLRKGCDTMRKLHWTASFILAASFFLPAQAPQSQDVPPTVIKTTTHLVQVSVV